MFVLSFQPDMTLWWCIDVNDNVCDDCEGNGFAHGNSSEISKYGKSQNIVTVPHC